MADNGRQIKFKEINQILAYEFIFTVGICLLIEYLCAESTIIEIDQEFLFKDPSNPAGFPPSHHSP